MLEECFSEQMPCKLGLEDEKEATQEDISSRGNSRCKGSESRESLAFLEQKKSSVPRKP